VVSGQIAGETYTLPIFVSKSFEQFQFEGAYAGAIVLAILALLTLLLMTIGGRRRDQQAGTAVVATAGAPVDPATQKENP